MHSLIPAYRRYQLQKAHIERPVKSKPLHDCIDRTAQATVWLEPDQLTFKSVLRRSEILRLHFCVLPVRQSSPAHDVPALSFAGQHNLGHVVSAWWSPVRITKTGIKRSDQVVALFATRAFAQNSSNRNSTL